MAKQCKLTGKSAMTGHNVSHSNIKTKRRFLPNLQTKKILNPATGKMVKVTLSTTAIRTLNKWRAAGKTFDLRKFLDC